MRLWGLCVGGGNGSPVGESDQELHAKVGSLLVVCLAMLDEVKDTLSMVSEACRPPTITFNSHSKVL